MFSFNPKTVLPIAKLTGSHAQAFAEVTIEVALVAKATLQSDVCQRQMFVFQQFLGMFDTALNQVLVRWHSCRAFELFPERVRIHADDPCQFMQYQALVEMGMNVVDHLPKLLMRESTFIRSQTGLGSAVMAQQMNAEGFCRRHQVAWADSWVAR